MMFVLFLLPQINNEQSQALKTFKSSENNVILHQELLRYKQGKKIVKLVLQLANSYFKVFACIFNTIY